MAKLTKAEMARLQHNNAISNSAKEAMLRAQAAADEAKQMMDLAIADNRALLKAKGIHYDPKKSLSFDDKGTIMVDGKEAFRGR